MYLFLFRITKYIVFVMNYNEAEHSSINQFIGFVNNEYEYCKGIRYIGELIINRIITLKLRILNPLLNQYRIILFYYIYAQISLKLRLLATINQAVLIACLSKLSS